MPGVFICGVFEDEMGICELLATAATLFDTGCDVEDRCSSETWQKAKIVAISSRICTASFLCADKIFFEINHFDCLHTVTHNVIHRKCAQVVLPGGYAVKRIFRRSADAG
jgi:hypothetical protein